MERAEATHVLDAKSCFRAKERLEEPITTAGANNAVKWIDFASSSDEREEGVRFEPPVFSKGLALFWASEHQDRMPLVGVRQSEPPDFSPAHSLG